MMKIRLNPTLGKLICDDLFVDKHTDEYALVHSDFYFKNQNKIEKINNYKYSAKDVCFIDRIFDMDIYLSAKEKTPCFVYLLWKDGEYYHCLTDWEKRVNHKMLTNEVTSLSNWYSANANFNNPVQKTRNGFLWEYDWGYISINYEERSYSCGIFISWK